MILSRAPDIAAELRGIADGSATELDGEFFSGSASSSSIRRRPAAARPLPSRGRAEPSSARTGMHRRRPPRS